MLSSTRVNQPKKGPQPKSVCIDRHAFTSPQAVVEDLRTLPSGPRILPELLSLLASNGSNLDAVIKLIRMERALAARVLKVSNNAHQAGMGECTSIEDAVGRLGFEQVHRLVINAIGLELAGKNLPSYGLKGVQLWIDTVTVAIAAELVAESVGLDPRTCYSLGLLHGVGMVVIDGWIQQKQLDLRFASTGFPADTTEIEFTTLGFNHAEVGAALLKKWNYPAELFDPIRWQYQPEKSLSYPKLAAVLFFARWIRDVAHCDNSVPLPFLTSNNYLGLTFRQLGALAEKTQERLAQSTDLLHLA
jgi:HD-like signal output (HDOD) protein